MGEWLLSRGDRLIVAKHEVPLEFGHLERVTRGDLCPEGGYRVQPGVSTGFQPWNPQNKRVRPEGVRG